jgi:hypothetical protein
MNKSPMPGQMYAVVDFDAKYNNWPDLVQDMDGANVITSRTQESWRDEQLFFEANGFPFAAARTGHKFLADIDLPVSIRETSPGKHHLYIDKEISWRQMVILLEAFASAGIIEDGYVQASLDRGFTALRLPWIRKE